MSHYTVLYYTILYYTILYYTILYYTILYHTILYYTILYYTILYYTILYYTILYYTILYYILLYCTVLGLKQPMPEPMHRLQRSCRRSKRSFERRPPLAPRWEDQPPLRVNALRLDVKSLCKTAPVDDTGFISAPCANCICQELRRGNLKAVRFSKQSFCFKAPTAKWLLQIESHRPRGGHPNKHPLSGGWSEAPCVEQRPARQSQLSCATTFDTGPRHYPQQPPIPMTET